MKQKYPYIILLLWLGIWPAAAQNYAEVFRNRTNRDDGPQSGAVTFLTMESVRHGMSGSLKGVQLRIRNSPCEEIPSVLVLSNPSGEPWQYEIYSGAGMKYAAGATGYDRIIPLESAGRYMIKFIHPNGLEAFDEVSIEKPEPLLARIFTDSTTRPVQGVPVAFTAACAAENEITWEMGDGKVYHDLRQIQHAYSLPGVYNVTLSVRRGACEKQTVQVVRVGVAAVAGNPTE